MTFYWMFIIGTYTVLITSEYFNNDTNTLSFSPSNSEGCACRCATWSLTFCDNQDYSSIILNPFSLKYYISCYSEMVVFQWIASFACVCFAIFHQKDSCLRSNCSYSEPGKLMAKFYLKFDTMKLLVKASACCSLEDLLHIICHSAEINCR